jgi:hypothetical protein
MRHSALSVILVALALLGGCAASRTASAPASMTSPPAPAPALVAGSSNIVGDLLAYYETLASLPNDQLEREYARAQQDFLKDNSARNRFRLVLLLALPGARFHDSNAALSLLNGYLARSRQDGLGNFAYLLANLIVEQNDREQKLKASQRRADLLQQQLEELKSIERSLSQRQIRGAPTP